MERRSLMGLALATAAAGAWAQTESGEHHHHHEGAGPFEALLASASHCVATGQACLAHCLMLLGMGDTSMADCSQSANQMLATCAALSSLAAQGSRLVPAMAGVALDACDQCRKACQPHADKHATCKACMEACDDCAKQCRAALAS